MPESAAFVGVDVSKAHLDVGVSGSEDASTFRSSPEREPGCGTMQKEAARLHDRRRWARSQRRLTPCGFVCRTVRGPGGGPSGEPRRVYEFLLMPWSRELDGQLELRLDGNTPEQGK